MVHQCSKLALYHHIFHSYIDIILLFKAQYLAKTDAPCVVLVAERKVTDWVQAEILKLIIVVGAMMIVITMESLVAMVTLMCCSSM